MLPEKMPSLWSPSATPVKPPNAIGRVVSYEAPPPVSAPASSSGPGLYFSATPACASEPSLSRAGRASAA